MLLGPERFKRDTMDRMLDFEAGELELPEIIELFSDLAFTGIINSLQGVYGRTMTKLIELGYLLPTGEILNTGKEEN